MSNESVSMKFLKSSLSRRMFVGGVIASSSFIPSGCTSVSQFAPKLVSAIVVAFNDFINSFGWNGQSIAQASLENPYNIPTEGVVIADLFHSSEEANQIVRGIEGSSDKKRYFATKFQRMETLREEIALLPRERGALVTDRIGPIEKGTLALRYQTALGNFDNVNGRMLIIPIRTDIS